MPLQYHHVGRSGIPSLFHVPGPPKMDWEAFISASLQHQEQHVFIIKDHQERNTRALLQGGGELEEQDAGTA